MFGRTYNGPRGVRLQNQRRYDRLASLTFLALVPEALGKTLQTEDCAVLTKKVVVVGLDLGGVTQATSFNGKPKSVSTVKNRQPNHWRGFSAAAGLRTMVSFRYPTGIPSKVTLPTLSMLPSGMISSV